MQIYGRNSEGTQSKLRKLPGDVASEMLEAARQRIDDSGHPLRITSKATMRIVWCSKTAANSATNLSRTEFP